MTWGVMAGQVGWGSGLIEEVWRKGPWTAEEDRLLIEYVRLHGEGRWNSVSRLAGLKRNGKSCRLRWVNYLRPDLKRGHITPQEEAIILELHARWGNRWSTIARSLPGRTDNEIKNYWRTHFKKKTKHCPDSSEKARNRLLRRQQFQQQQQQQLQLQPPQRQQQQMLQLPQLDMKKIISLLEENENKLVSYVPQMPNTTEEHGLFYNMLNINGSSLPEASSSSSSEDNFLWDGLWNLEDIHAPANAMAYATGKAGMHNLVAPFC